MIDRSTLPSPDSYADTLLKFLFKSSYWKGRVYLRSAGTVRLVRLLGLALVFFCGDISWAAPAASTGSSNASGHYETGLGLFALGHFENAVSEFRKAYEVEARPDFLLQIGRSYEQLGQVDKALYFFKRYLQTTPPDAAGRKEAEAFVIGHEVLAPAPDRAAAPPTTLSTPALAAAAPTAWNRWWFWPTVGAAALAALGVGLVLAGGTHEKLPASDLGHMRF